MSDTYFSATSIVWLAPTQCVDIQIPHLNNPIAFIRFEGQSLAVALLKSLNLGMNIFYIRPCGPVILKI